ncbi:DUF1360 domain-containing protein [Streptomyces sp. NPDC059278]|uniref:DUF1360 domain-containing protein n=1 Tax=Streptomyces sp. NPDC059278 TaxID=3346801 RepID=UPI00368110DF
MAWLSVSAFVAFLSVLAICRITRFVTEDTLTKPIRDWVEHKAAQAPLSARPPGRAGGKPGGRFWHYADKLLNCPWCSGFWISAAVTLAYFRCWLGAWPDTPHTLFAYAVAAPAASWVSAILSDWLDSPPPVKVVQLAPAHLDITNRQVP